DPFSGKGANYNRLISAAQCDPISGSAPHRSTRCALRPLAGSGSVKPAWQGFREAVVTEVEEVARGCTRVGFAI
ncbi:hypothetical protein, partial [Tritonibacter mobilis]